jgi:hypothetical protein
MQLCSKSQNYKKLRIEGARPGGVRFLPGPRWRSALCPKKPALGHGYEANS